MGQETYGTGRVSTVTILLKILMYTIYLLLCNMRYVVVLSILKWSNQLIIEIESYFTHFQIP